MPFARRAALFLGAGFLVLPVPQAFSSPPPPATVHATLSAPVLIAGAGAEIAVTVSLETGWHIYSLTQPAGGPIATTVTLDPGSPLEPAGEIRQSAFETHREPVFAADVESFSGKAEFLVPVRVDPMAKPSKYTATVRVRFQACDGKMCLAPADHTVDVGFEVVAKGTSPVQETAAGARAEAPKKEAPAPPASASDAPASSPSLDLRPLYETARAWEGDRVASSKLADALPGLLAGRTFTGDDAYDAGRLWVKAWGASGKEEYLTSAAAQFEAYLASAASLRYAEQAEAYLIFALSQSHRLDEALRRFDPFWERYKGQSRPSDMSPGTTCTELASTILAYSLGEAKRYSDVERVARLCLGELRKKREGDDRNIAFVTGQLLLALEGQKKSDDAAKARVEAAKSFDDADRMMAWAEWSIAFAKVEDLMQKADPAGALKVLEGAHGSYVKAGMEKLYDATLQRFKVAGRRAPRLEADAWLNSPPLTLDAVRGKVVVLDFWMTWCGPCRMSFPKMEALAKADVGKGLVIVGVTQSQGWVLTKDGRSIGKDDKEPPNKLAWDDEVKMLKEFVRDFGITVPVAVGRRRPNPTKVATQTATGKDEFLDTPMLAEYGVSFFPSAVVIDRKGIVRFSGAIDDDALATLVTRLLDEPAS